MHVKSTIQLHNWNPSELSSVPLLCFGLRALVLFTLNDHRSEVILAFLVVRTVRSVTVRPILGLPAAAERGLLGDVLDVDHVHYLGLGHTDATVYLGARLGPSLRAKRQVGHIDQASDGGSRRDQ